MRCPKIFQREPSPFGRRWLRSGRMRGYGSSDIAPLTRLAALGTLSLWERVGGAITAFVVVTALAGPTAAQQPSSRCLVNDPSTTPLNLRSSPMGTIIGTLANRQTVQILEQTVDDRGRSWARVTVVSGAGAGREGWVFREFIACF